MIALATAAVLAGARSLTAIAEWTTDAPPLVLAALGVARDPLTGTYRVPGETTLRRVLGGIDGDALDAAVSGWLADRLPAPGPWQRRAVAVDGKTLRGAARSAGRPVHLLAAMDHATGAVLAQRQVDGAPEEVTGFRPLLADLDLTDVVVTADALHPSATPPGSSSPTSTPTTCSRSRATSPACTPSSVRCPGARSRCWTGPVTAATAGSRPAR